MRTYDVMIIIDEKRFDDGGDAFSKDVDSYLQSLGAQVKERNAMGRRTFARPIGRATAGIYWEFVVDLDPAKVTALMDKYRLNPAVLRMQVLTYSPPAPGGKSAAAAAAQDSRM